MAKPFHFGIDGRVFFDKSVRLRHVCLRLVVVVVGHEIFDRVMGEQLPQFICKLSGEGLVVGQNKRGSLQTLDQPRRGSRFARSGCPKQGDICLSGEYSLFKLV